MSVHCEYVVPVGLGPGYGLPGAALFSHVHKQPFIFKRIFQIVFSPPSHPVDLMQMEGIILAST